MAAIKQRKTKYSVIYWYVNEQGERKQKWDTVDTIGEAKSRKVFVEFYQEKYGQAIVPNEETYFQRVADEKAKMGKEGGADSQKNPDPKKRGNAAKGRYHFQRVPKALCESVRNVEMVYEHIQRKDRANKELH